MLGITDLWAYVVGAIVIVLLPGPNSLYVLSVAAQRGVSAGYEAASGVFLGDTILMVIAAVGGASLLASTPTIFMAVKAVGAVYLAWLGVGLVRDAWRSWSMRGDAMASKVQVPVDDQWPFRKALVISLLNPKAILFLLSFFIQFVDPTYPHPALSFVILGAIVQLISFIYLSTLIVVGTRLAAAFAERRRTSAAARAGVGTLFVGFGAKLAATTL